MYEVNCYLVENERVVGLLFTHPVSSIRAGQAYMRKMTNVFSLQVVNNKWEKRNSDMHNITRQYVSLYGYRFCVDINLAGKPNFEKERLIPKFIKSEKFDIEVGSGSEKQTKVVKVFEYLGNDEYVLEEQIPYNNKKEPPQRYTRKLTWTPLEVFYGDNVSQAKELVKKCSDAELLEIRDFIKSELKDILEKSKG